MNPHAAHRIESPDNPAFKQFKKLLTPRGLRKQEMALVAGERIVSELLISKRDAVMAWLSTTDHSPPSSALPPAARWYQLATPLFRELDVVGTNAPLLVLKTPPLGTWSTSDGFDTGCTLLIPFQDPENVGSVIRSAAAFGVDRVVLLEEAANPYHYRAIRASAGAVFSAALFNGPPLGSLPERPDLYALSPRGRDIGEITFPQSFGLVAGMEGDGVPARLRAHCVSIPIGSAVESLNSATATAIALYTWAHRAGRSER